MSKIIVNGRFFSQRLTGVQRFALELMKELDRLVGPGQVEIAIPKNATDVPEFENIAVKQVGRLKGHLWEQISFPLYTMRNRVLTLNLCNPSPLLSPGIVCFHDAKIKVTPQFFSKAFLYWYKVLFFNTRKRAKAILTTSVFSKSEFCKYYFIPTERIHVIPCGWQHFVDVPFSEGTPEKYGLTKNQYCFSVSSLEPNKNFRWIAEAAKYNPTLTFAVAGSLNKKVFAEGLGFECPPNMKLLGYISDTEVKTLMRDSKAVCYPSFYEGFGVPVLEAMSVGAKAICSNIGCIRQIYGDTVYYVDPFDPEVDIEKLLEKEVRDPGEVLNKYSWADSARRLKQVLDEQLKASGGVPWRQDRVIIEPPALQAIACFMPLPGGSRIPKKASREQIAAASIHCEEAA